MIRRTGEGHQSSLWESLWKDYVKGWMTNEYRDNPEQWLEFSVLSEGQKLNRLLNITATNQRPNYNIRYKGMWMSKQGQAGYTREGLEIRDDTWVGKASDFSVTAWNTAMRNKFPGVDYRVLKKMREYYLARDMDKYNAVENALLRRELEGLRITRKPLFSTSELRDMGIV